jgi:hypothetical protein
MPGENRVLLVRMVDDRITHFTDVLVFNATATGRCLSRIKLEKQARKQRA